MPDVVYAGMMQYDGDLQLPRLFLVQPPSITESSGQYLAENNVTQFAISETQKYGHVTYFWNGNRSAKFDEATEIYLEIPSDTVPFEQRPWMKAAETADAVVDAVESGAYAFIRANLAGGDMVGHTGSVRAATMAVEAVDLAIHRIRSAVRDAGGTLVVTADHGNADDMVERDKQGRALMRDDGEARWRTSHSLNPVPFYVLDCGGRTPQLRADLDQAGLANVAATLIELLGYEPPEDYEPSLLEWV